jgi:hypothetical protein
MADQNEPNVPATYQKQVAATIEKARKAARDRKKAERERGKMASMSPDKLYQKLAKKYNELDELYGSNKSPELERQFEEVGQALDAAREACWKQNLDSLSLEERAALDDRIAAFERVYEAIKAAPANTYEIVSDFEKTYPPPPDLEHSYFHRFGMLLDRVPGEHSEKRRIEENFQKPHTFVVDGVEHFWLDVDPQICGYTCALAPVGTTKEQYEDRIRRANLGREFPALTPRTEANQSPLGFAEPFTAIVTLLT